MIRLILTVLWIALVLLVGMPVLMVERFLIRKLGKEKENLSSFAYVRRAMKVVLFLCGTRVEIEGLENIPENEPVLFIGNHRSLFDIPVGYSFMKRPTGYIAKKELARFAPLKLWMDQVNCLFMDRKDVKQSLKVILDAITKLKSGISMWIFPEGTRSKSDCVKELLTFKEGSMKPAEKTGCKVIPVAICDTAEIWEKHKFYIKPCTVKVKIGTPISIKELPKEEQKKSGALLRSEIIKMLEQMQGE